MCFGAVEKKYMLYILSVLMVFFTNLMKKILYFNTLIILLYMFQALLCSSSGGQLYHYSICYRHCLWVTVQYIGYERTPLVTCVLNSHLKKGLLL